MANQSIVSIPPNVEDPTVLRRVLTRIVEQLDTVYGSRTGEDAAYVSRSQLTNSVDELQRQLAAVQTTASADAVEAAEFEQLEADLAALTDRVTSLETAVQDLVPEAPEDGKLYGRQNKAWVEIVLP